MNYTYLRQQLAIGELQQGSLVSEIQLEVNLLRIVEGPLRIGRDEVPHFGVRHMNGAEEVSRRRRRTVQGPQERV